MDGTQFYTSNNLDKYPNDGKLPKCKKCITMHVDNWNPDTYLWILQECDVPYIPEQWNQLMGKFAKDRTKVTGMTILGRYLSAMKLNQWKDYRWKDSQFLQDLQNKKIEETMKQQGYDIQDITTAIQRASFTLPSEELKEPPPPAPPPLDFGNSTEDYFKDKLDFDVPDLGAELTDEDKRYLYLKWGKGYSPDEWVRLEQLFNEMMQSYDIQSAGHIDTLKLACKTSLKSNQLLDIGDVDGAQKMIKMYDSLMKSGKFTAAQNKEESGDFVDSVGELIAMCEKDGFIPRYVTDVPQDKVDATLKDMNDYVKKLVTQDLGFGQQIEDALKKIQIQKEMEESFDQDVELDDNDFEEYHNAIEEQKQLDEEELGDE